jgi:hypothetical protein
MRYPHIELEPDTFLEEVFGWTLLDHAPGLKLLARSIGPARKLFLLMDRPRKEAVDELASRHRLTRPMTMLTACDFGWVPGDAELTVKGKTLPVVDAPRMRFAPTFVFDLSESEEALFSKIASRERSKIRKSERSGMRAEMIERPTASDLERFLELYTPMAQGRGLEPLRVEPLRRAFDRGHMVLARAVDASGRAATIYLLYVLPKHGYYLYAAHDSSAPDPAGHMLFWKSLLYLRARGVRWFDFGMVGSTDPNDGIYRFKKCFGGAFVTPGREWEMRPRWMASAALLARRGRTLLTTVRLAIDRARAPKPMWREEK